jgi:FkbM family methyltransferase
MRVSLLSKFTSVLPDRLFVRLVAWQYRFFEPELRRLGEFVPKERSAVDVGAWWGPWSWWLARRVPVVHAFEPNPAIAGPLSVAAPSNVRVHAEAVSDEIGRATLWIPPGGRGTEGRASLLPLGGTSITVPTTTLDSLDVEQVGFLKIDVEGHEYQVLNGASQMLRRDRPNVVLEIEQQFHPDGPSIHDVFNLLTAKDYEGRFLQNGRWHPLESFDVKAHQLDTVDQVQRSGLVRNTLLNSRRYVNNFVFFPKETV